MRKILTNSALLSFLFIGLSFVSVGQTLQENPLLVNQSLIQKRQALEAKSMLRSASIYDTISLPATGIKDDFSYTGPYPDTALWLDNFVYINNNYGKAPVSMGVATFDGLSNLGIPYDWTVSSTSSNVADYLTSKAIDLSTVAAGDTTLYLSFYYQPQGLGNAPEAADSLVLEMKGTGAWTHAWSKKGTTLSSLDSSWTLVMIPIRDPLFLVKGFQFRFKNYATISGSLDHWNLDYVYLNKNRTANDTLFEDIAFVNELPGLLTTYSAMPWRQYAASDMSTGYATTIRNNFDVVKNGSFSYKIFDAAGTQVNTTYSGGSTNIDPYVTSGNLSYAPFTSPTLNYTIPALTDTAEYTMQCIVNSTPDFNRGNDTIEHKQIFRYYYAYDDGSAETAFGLNVDNSMMAEKFVLSTSDTLRYIDISFNPILIDASQFSFNLLVWTASGSVPGTLVYSGANAENPGYVGAGVDGFMHYELETPVFLNPGTFFIGFIQHTNQFLNVGVDKNTNTQTNIYYNVSGTWNTSPIPGSLLMHPVFGSAADFVGIHEHASIGQDWKIYPNPAGDQIHITGSNDVVSEKVKIELTDITGRTIVNTNLLNSTLDVSSLHNGIYFVRITDQGNVTVKKLVVQR